MPTITQRGLWRYAARFDPPLPPESWLSLGEGGTPAIELPELASVVGLERLLLKREDLNPTGSHKDRGLAFQIALLRDGAPGSLDWLAISSSGNAALAASAYAARAGLRLAVFLAPSTPAATCRRLLRLGARVFVSSRATSLAAELAEARGIPNLRPSTDPAAVEGFQSIAWELVEYAPHVESLFTFASSGTSLVGIGRGFARAEGLAAPAWRPALHVVQGTAAQPLAGPLDARPVTAPPGHLGARGARKTRRLGEAVRLIRASGGAGWVVTDAEAATAGRRLAALGVETSLEGAAALAAAERAAREGGIRSAVLVLTGRAEPGADAAGSGPALTGPTLAGLAGLHPVESLAEVEAELFG